MEEIDERCRYTYYKLIKTDHIWLDSARRRSELVRISKPSLSEYKKDTDLQIKLLRKHSELSHKVKKVCPEFMYKYPVRGFDLTKWSEVHSKTKQNVNRDFDSQTS